MSRLLSASLRKSFADVTRRKGRALLVALGIFIGVFGLTAINTAEDALFAAMTFSMSSHAVQPDILYVITYPALPPTLPSLMSKRCNIRRCSTPSGMSARRQGTSTW
jgi:hypothetical protein